MGKINTLEDAILQSMEDINRPADYMEIYNHILKNDYYPLNFNAKAHPSGTVSGRLTGLYQKGIIDKNKQGRTSFYFILKNILSKEEKKIIKNETKENKLDSHYSESPIRKEENKYSFHNELDDSTNYVDSDGVEEETEEYQPFNPEEISINTKTISMEGCLRRLEQGTIILAPEFQRNEVWDIKQKSRLIESIMLKIPIPMFYVAADAKEVYSVVDGLQRLSTIKDFVLGKKYLETKEAKYKGEGIRLKDLEFWGDSYNNFNFKSLPVVMQNRILETEFIFTIINPGTPEEVKRNVFKRINTGGAPLTAQEIRHALYVGQSSDLLLKLSLKDEFLSATNGTIKPSRMMDRELILRFLSFLVRDYKQYPLNNDMDAFLSDTMRIINMLPDLNKNDSKKLFPDEESKKQIIIRDIYLLEELFITVMVRAKTIFGVDTFRKSYPGKRKTPVNKSLFEVWGVLLSKISNEEFYMLEKNKALFLEEYQIILEDIRFVNAISRDSWKQSVGVRFRHEKLSEILNKYIYD